MNHRTLPRMDAASRKLIDYFPLSVASGAAFCNREAETERLKTCIEYHRPVLLISPRRYGKTSLALHAIQQMKVPFAHIDLFSAVDEYDIEKCILQGIGKLIARMESIPKRALALANQIFGGSHIKAVFSKLEVSIEMHRRPEKSAYHILDLLEKLEKLAKKSDKKIVLFFDEFQCIHDVTPHHAIESVLRQVAQLTKSISFIFSGSHRHLLNQLFDDRNRPFYKLCERITLERISETHYTKHIQKMAKKIWHQYFSDRSLENIFIYSHRHPYYMNLLCSRLFLLKTLPSSENIQAIWEQYIQEERSSVASEIELLSKNQRKLLTILARTQGTSEPFGKPFIQQASMSKATIDQALTFLENRDYIERDAKHHIHIIDPLIKTVLAGNE